MSDFFSHHHQRNFLLQQTETDAEVHSRTLLTNHSKDRFCLHQIPPLRAQGTLSEEEMLDPDGAEDTRTQSSKSAKQGSYELTETEEIITRATWVCSRSSMYKLWFSIYYFFGAPGCMNEWVTDSYVLLGLFSFCWVALLRFFVIFLVHLIILYVIMLGCYL